MTGPIRETSEKIGCHVSRSAPAPASSTITGCPALRCSRPAVETRICTPSTAIILVGGAPACAVNSATKNRILEVSILRSNRIDARDRELGTIQPVLHAPEGRVLVVRQASLPFDHVSAAGGLAQVGRLFSEQCLVRCARRVSK